MFLLQRSCSVAFRALVRSALARWRPRSLVVSLARSRLPSRPVSPIPGPSGDRVASVAGHYLVARPCSLHDDRQTMTNHTTVGGPRLGVPTCAPSACTHQRHPQNPHSAVCTAHASLCRQLSTSPPSLPLPPISHRAPPSSHRSQPLCLLRARSAHSPRRWRRAASPSPTVCVAPLVSLTSPASVAAPVGYPAVHRAAARVHRRGRGLAGQPGRGRTPHAVLRARPHGHRLAQRAGAARRRGCCLPFVLQRTNLQLAAVTPRRCGRPLAPIEDPSAASASLSASRLRSATVLRVRPLASPSPHRGTRA
jgi:hypothetical protein